MTTHTHVRWLLYLVVMAMTLPARPSAVRHEQSELTPAAAQEDFDALWQYVADNYAYFDSRLTDWRSVPQLYESDLAGVDTREELIAVLERVLDELHDPHAHLTANTSGSPRLVPSGADIWAEWRDGRAIVEQVRDDSDAERSGIRAGADILALNDVPIAEALKSRIGRSIRTVDDRVRSWALRAVLAGHHNQPRRIRLQMNGSASTVTLPGPDQFVTRKVPLTSRMLPDDIGYIRFHDSLGDRRVIAEFDAALARFESTSGLVLDLRDTPGGGNTSIARAVLGRFVDRERPYQKHLLPSEERETGVVRSWLELVSARGPFRYSRPVVLLVGHWTGSMGEGLAIGFDAVNAATIVGTRMAQLLGATYQFELPHSHVGMNVPAEKLFHVNGTAREAFVPGVLVTVEDLIEPGEDPWMVRAVEVLRRAPRLQP